MVCWLVVFVCLVVCLVGWLVGWLPLVAVGLFGLSVGMIIHLFAIVLS